MGKRFLITLATFLVIGGVAVLAVILAKGYTFSPSQGGLAGTGIISVASTPDGASVYIDGHLTTATNTTISQLQPKSYSLKIVKEGFIPWEKSVEVKEGVVSEIKATLFPALPTIYPLTYNGVVNPALSPDGQKLVFAVPLSDDSHSRQRGGIWVWTMTSQPIAFARGAEPHQIVVSSQGLDFSKATFRFSPDSTQLLVNMQEGTGPSSERNYLLSVDRQTGLSDLRDITPVVAGKLKEWEEDQKAKDEARILAIPVLQTRQIASASASKINGNTGKIDNFMKWSPDETKFITGDASVAKVYDLVLDKSYTLPEAKAYTWLPDSRHVVLIAEDKVSVSEFDGSNVAVIFAGKFEGTSVFPWPDSSKMVLLTSFNTPTASTPNLFGINLK